MRKFFLKCTLVTLLSGIGQGGGGATVCFFNIVHLYLS